MALELTQADFEQPNLLYFIERFKTATQHSSYLMVTHHKKLVET
jgi:hypothetical protein